MSIIRIDQYTSDGRLRSGYDYWAIYAAFAPVRSDRAMAKVGISSCPLRRAYQIHCGSPYPLEVVLWAWVGSKRRALSVERAIHARLSEKRTRGEWFEFDTASQEDKALFHAVSKAAYARATGSMLKWTRNSIEQIQEAANLDWKSIPA